MYRVEISPKALKQMDKLPNLMTGLIREKLYALADNPRPLGVTKLKGSQNDYRIRIGTYRVIYAIEDDVLIITVIKVAHRREVYR